MRDAAATYRIYAQPRRGIRIGRPRIGSSVAILFSVSFLLAALRSEQVAVWLLARDFVGESVSRDLQTSVRLAAQIAALVIALPAWRVVGWPLAIILRTPVVQEPIGGFARMAGGLWSGATGFVSAVAGAARSVIKYVLESLYEAIDAIRNFVLMAKTTSLNVLRKLFRPIVRVVGQGCSAIAAAGLSVFALVQHIFRVVGLVLVAVALLLWFGMSWLIAVIIGQWLTVKRAVVQKVTAAFEEARAILASGRGRVVFLFESIADLAAGILSRVRNLLSIVTTETVWTLFRLGLLSLVIEMQALRLIEVVMVRPLVAVVRLIQRIVDRVVLFIYSAIATFVLMVVRKLKLVYSAISRAVRSAAIRLLDFLRLIASFVLVQVWAVAKLLDFVIIVAVLIVLFALYAIAVAVWLVTRSVVLKLFTGMSIAGRAIASQWRAIKNLLSSRYRLVTAVIIRVVHRLIRVVSLPVAYVQMAFFETLSVGRRVSHAIRASLYSVVESIWRNLAAVCSFATKTVNQQLQSARHVLASLWHLSFNAIRKKAANGRHWAREKLADIGLGLMRRVDSFGQSVGSLLAGLESTIGSFIKGIAEKLYGGYTWLARAMSRVAMLLAYPFVMASLFVARLTRTAAQQVAASVVNAYRAIVWAVTPLVTTVRTRATTVATIMRFAIFSLADTVARFAHARRAQLIEFSADVMVIWLLVVATASRVLLRAMGIVSNAARAWGSSLVSDISLARKSITRQLRRVLRFLEYLLEESLEFLVATTRQVTASVSSLRQSFSQMAGGTRQRSKQLGRATALGARNFQAVIVLGVAIFLALSGGISALAIAMTQPEPPIVIYHWTTEELSREGLLVEMAAAFNNTGYKTDEGKRFEVRIETVPANMMVEYLANRVTDGTKLDLNRLSNGLVSKKIGEPVLVSSPSVNWFTQLNYEAGTKVVDVSSSGYIASSQVGIATYREMADCLGWPEQQIGFNDLFELRSTPDGWGSKDCFKSSWGSRPLVAFTDPLTSSIGRSVLLSLYSIGSGKTPGMLETSDIRSPEAGQYVSEFQGLIDHFSFDSASMVSNVRQGTRFGHFFVTSEQDLARLNAAESERNGRSLGPQDTIVMMHPEEGRIKHQFCACAVSADWVDDQERAAATAWVEYLQTPERQAQFVHAGLRSIFDSTEIASDAVEIDVSGVAPDVIAAVQEAWVDIKRPAVVVFAMDTSGSMLGPKMRQAKEGLIAAMNSMPSNSQAGLVAFSDSVVLAVEVGPLTLTREDMNRAITDQRASGETALYDAIRTAIEMADAAVSPEAATRAVVVLTDGQANKGTTKLDELIVIESVTERSIEEFDGFEGGKMPVDSGGAEVHESDVFGVDLRIDTEHEIQIFFVGVGSDANLDVARMLAEATGAEFEGVAGEDLANLLERISGYF